jgi:hypothetical protein
MVILLIIFVLHTHAKSNSQVLSGTVYISHNPVFKLTVPEPCYPIPSFYVSTQITPVCTTTPG